MTDTKRALNVCYACIRRKKACDKALPACGFCASRRLPCTYHVSAQKSKGRRIYNPGKHFVPLASPSPLCVVPQSVDESLHQRAQHFIELTKLTCDDIIDRYFATFHRWLPVVSPDSFRREASRYQEQGRLPPADFTVLLLAMLLIVLPALGPSVRPPRANHELLYTATKSALAQAQACICASQRLVQAAVLIALREYTGVRPEAAYISMMTCAGLARVVGIGTASAAGASDSRLEDVERDNLAWAIAMLERLVLCEMDQGHLQPQTAYPGPDFRLPSDLKPTAELDAKPWPNLQALNRVTSWTLDAADVDYFGRQAQLVSLLDRLLSVMRCADGDTDTKLAGLADLDSKIRTFLEVVMSELEWRHTLLCVLVALCVRLLFLLHGSVLDTLSHPNSEADHEKREISWLGLNMVCRMTLDVAEWHGEEPSQLAPICRFYNLRAARRHLQERSRLVADEALSRDIDTLLRAEEIDRNKWVF